MTSGFVYAAAEDRAHPMAKARAGVRVRRVERRPPWIVVDGSIGNVVVARWPGRLWRVGVVEVVSVADGRATGVGPAEAGAGYVRAVAVDVIEEVPAWGLFGERGEAVARIIDRCRTLTLRDVERLAKARDAEAGAAYSRAWEAWLAGVEGGELHRGAEHRGTLAVPGAAGQSPVGAGLMVLYRVMSDRAKALVGEAAFRTDDEGERYFEPTWDRACAAALEAAMGVGMMGLGEGEGAVLTGGWRGVMG